MAFDSEGNFIRVHNWEQDRLNDIGIVSDRHDEEDNNFAAAFNACFLRDGRVPLSGELKMNGHQIKNIADGTSANDAISKSQLEDAIQTLQTSIMESLVSNLGLGDIKASLQTANHGNWLLCDGQAVSRTTYADLFSLIGTTYGAGDGVTTFNVPDYTNVLLATSTNVSVCGNGKTLGLTNGTDNVALGVYSNNESLLHNMFVTTDYGENVGSTSATGSYSGPLGRWGVTTDATKSGLAGAIVSTIHMNYFIKAKEEV